MVSFLNFLAKNAFHVDQTFIKHYPIGQMGRIKD